MKVIVGKREDSTCSEASFLVKMFLAPNLIEPRRTFNCKCSNCRSKVQITIFEEINSGEIWIEGPDKCKCGHRLAVENIPDIKLSQKAIVSLFGE